MYVAERKIKNKEGGGRERSSPNTSWTCNTAKLTDRGIFAATYFHKKDCQNMKWNFLLLPSFHVLFLFPSCLVWLYMHICFALYTFGSWRRFLLEIWSRPLFFLRSVLLKITCVLLLSLSGFFFVPHIYFSFFFFCLALVDFSYVTCVLLLLDLLGNITILHWVLPKILGGCQQNRRKSAGEIRGKSLGGSQQNRRKSAGEIRGKS